MDGAAINITQEQKVQASLKYLFFTFLKIGCVSFGGYMALVALVQKVMVDQDEVLDNDTILDSVTVASLLPGPLAVNIVAYIGYHLKGKAGAVISMLAVLLPACTLILLLSWLYFNYSYKIEWAQIMQYVAAAVSAIILSAGMQLFKKEIAKNYPKALLCLFTIAVISWFNSYLVTITLILTGAVAGLFLSGNKYKNIAVLTVFKSRFKFSPTSVLIGLLLINEGVFISNIYKNINSILLKMGIVFSGISLSLFGGGYVMVPIMQSLFVKDLHWVTTQQFVDTIAFSQATPGPILVSATFIGYKLAGIAGAILATVAMFGPSAVLMIVVSKLFKKNKDHSLVKDMVSGIKVVVIGLIISSAFKIFFQQHLSVLFVAVGLVSLLLSFKYKINPVYLIIGSITLGVIAKFYGI
ncbi:chromate transporter [Mucilaginibacter sp. OK268]|uniref:chromate efflux transporter n=1 Tax=Mucilaginibacter sp. OK268 TaxID=1881048 RepID=UPI000880CA25|nr:chromate efflux transporter [Mucilaginibacter sp. OK268]SDP20267.1 chromate transporter [Mucilaginibacter sp. OK268]